jgi:hypothetical protein
MLGHIGLRSTEPDRLIAFYEAAFAPLGIAGRACRRGEIHGLVSNHVK